MRSQGQVSAAPRDDTLVGSGRFISKNRMGRKLFIRWDGLAMEPAALKETNNPRAKRHFSYRPWKADPARRSSNATAPSVSLRSRSARAHRAAQRWHAREYTHAQLAFDDLTTSRQEHQYGHPQMIRK